VIRRFTLAGIAVALIAMGAAVGIDANTAAFTDPAGDGLGGVDLTSISVADTDRGALQFLVTGSGFDVNTDVTVDLDTDHNPRTGDQGDDYRLVFFDDPSLGWLYESDRWQGGWIYYDAGSATLLAASGTLAATVPRADIGGSDSFAFYVVAEKYDASDTVVARDDAPDDSRWSYDAVPLTSEQKVKPVLSDPLSSAAYPVAGEQFTLRYALTRSDNGAPFAGVVREASAWGGGGIREVHASASGGIVTVKVPLQTSDRTRLLFVYLTVASPYETAHSAKLFFVR
jgi:hypothetical protein